MHDAVVLKAPTTPAASLCDPSSGRRGVQLAVSDRKHPLRDIIAQFGTESMEAEQVNAIARRLSDVEGRAAELRRYL